MKCKELDCAPSHLHGFFNLGGSKNRANSAGGGLLAANNGFLCLRIEDDGIKKSLQDKLFQYFSGMDS